MIFILGVDDPEMIEIENVLRSAGARYGHALDTEGNLVTPRSAYKTVAVLFDRDSNPYTVRLEALREAPYSLVFVECGCDFAAHGIAPRIVDHHEPGHPGYGCPPAEYWTGSSIGQVCAMLGVEPTPELRMVAAADHCLAAAYAGQCPSIDPDELFEHRVAALCSPSRASNRSESRTPDQVRASIEAARLSLDTAPVLMLGGAEIADLRGDMIPDLPEAAMIAGRGYLAGGVSLRAGEAPKIVIQGCGEGTRPGTAPIVEFKETWAPAQGLTGIYGNPGRGSGGGYL